MDLERLQGLLRLFENSSLSELEVEEEGRRICLRKNPAAMALAAPVIPVTSAPIPLGGPAPVMDSAPSPQSTSSAAAAEHKAESDMVTIDSPMVGVFYNAPAPGEPPFVSAGDMIEENQTLCIVEAMKLMNEVTAKFAAKIVKVLVENGEPVEFGQPMFAVQKFPA